MMNIQFDENVKPIQIEVTSDFLRARKGLYIKQASACQPPTREICCIGPGVVDSWEKELYIMLDTMYLYIYISKYIYVYFWRLR